MSTYVDNTAREEEITHTKEGLAGLRIQREERPLCQSQTIYYGNSVFKGLSLSSGQFFCIFHPFSLFSSFQKFWTRLQGQFSIGKKAKTKTSHFLLSL